MHYTIFSIMQTPTDIVCVALRNGLGNRIFQVLAGLAYAEKHKKTLCISRAFIHPGFRPHEKNLDGFLLRIFPDLKYIDTFSNYTTIQEKHYFKYDTLPKVPGNVLLTGYFQCPLYFPSRALVPVIRTTSYPNTFFVHVRGGDYLEHQGEWGFDIVSYYKKCFDKLKSRQKVKYLVFSNDNQYADNMMKQFNVPYTISDKEDPVDSLIEMANCEGGICVNSTFGWLGAFFQGTKMGQIFMPSIWNNTRDCKGVYPSWATIIKAEPQVPMALQVSQIVNQMDIVIPVGPNDRSVIEDQIKYTKKNIIGYRNIYLIYKDTSLQIDGCITITEDLYPFNKDTVAKYHGKLDRNGWYLQQLLKLYAGNIIPGILDTYLVIDSDTFFLKPTVFQHNGKWLYCFGVENHKPYFDHMARLHPSFVKMDPSRSGICHHMVFQKKYVNEMLKLVEDKHGGQFFDIFLKEVTLFNDSGASEYEMYFNYMLKTHPSEILLRNLRWQNVARLTGGLQNDYESVHWYCRA